MLATGGIGFAPNCTGGNVSITSFNEGQNHSARPKITTLTIQEKKQRREPITCLTAYDYATARLVDEWHVPQ